MKPPRLFAAQRGRLLGWIICSTLVQAAAFAAVAIATRNVFIAHHAGTGLPVFYILSVSLAGACAALMQLIFRNLAEHLGQDYARDIRLSLFDHASRSDQKDLDQRRMGYHILRFTGDLTALTGWPGLGLPRLVQAAILLPASTAVLIYLNVQFVWVALCVILPSALWLALTQRKLLNAHRHLRKHRARLAADVTERLPVAPKLAAMGRRKVERNILDRRATEVMQSARFCRRISETRKSIPDLSAAFAASAIMLLGSLNGLPTSTIAAALAALGLMIRPLRNLMSSTDQAAKFCAAHSNLTRALQRPLAAKSSRKARLRRKPHSIEITPVEGPTLKLAAGESAVIPASLMDEIENVLTGNSVTKDFSLKLGGKDVAELTPGSLRRSVGVVTENPLILKGSLRRAITLGLRPRPSDASILQAAEKLGLKDTLSEIGGLDFRLTERGTNVKAGHRLAISILRLVLQQPGLILVKDAALLRSFERAEHFQQSHRN
ncbi:ABC transporter transmembrane domain-containing protein [Ruegeria jejuensis]|uniref:ABC transporter transmembrane domain-containing protein n=1 Tax=Ruegeria jejuensis TaxID=3233338 RepID=UPI00355C37B9